MMKKIVICLLVVPIVAGCETQKNSEKHFKFDESEPVHHDYFEVEEKFVSWADIFGIKSDHYFVYFYSTTCSHCSELKDWIIEAALIKQNIYFCRESNQDKISKNISQTIGVFSSDQLCILGYPSLIEIVEKIIVKNVAGKTQIERALN